MAADAQKTGAGGPDSHRSGADPEREQARLQELSRKLLDLWQDHLSAVAQDPNLLAQALKVMTAAPLAWMPGFPPQGGAGFAQPANPFQFSFSAAAPAAAPGPAPAAAAPAAGADDLGQLRRRLAELEGRLAELESGSAGPRGRAAGGGGKPKPGAGKPRRRAGKS